MTARDPHRVYMIVLAALITAGVAGMSGMAGAAEPDALVRARLLHTLRADAVQPTDIAAAGTGSVYLLDGVNNRVAVFSDTGQFQFYFGKAGEGPGEFNFPLGICIDDQNCVYVADSGNGRVQAFTPDGTFLFNIDLAAGRQTAAAPDPTDVVVNRALQRCYIVDNDNHCVHSYDLLQKQFLTTIGTMGMEPPELRFPFLADRDSRGNLYVVEVINTRVKALGPDGEFLHNIGGWGVEPGEFYRPKGVAIDKNDRVFVSDGVLGVVQVFDARGTFLGALADGQGKLLKFKTPAGMCIDARNRLYVVESLENRVSVLQLLP